MLTPTPRGYFRCHNCNEVVELPQVVREDEDLCEACAENMDEAARAEYEQEEARRLAQPGTDAEAATVLAQRVCDDLAEALREAQAARDYAFALARTDTEEEARRLNLSAGSVLLGLERTTDRVQELLRTTRLALVKRSCGGRKLG
jgi:hypothetical protein